MQNKLHHIIMSPTEYFILQVYTLIQILVLCWKTFNITLIFVLLLKKVIFYYQFCFLCL